MTPNSRKTAFTIVEMLTVLGIIVVLVSILVPALNAAKRFSKVVTQRGQFHEIAKGLEAFSHDYDGYPESADNCPPSAGGTCSELAYSGAMKLCEVMVGKDNLGFHEKSQLLCTGVYPGTTEPLYLPIADNAKKLESLQSRKPVYLERNYSTYAISEAWTTVTPFTDSPDPNQATRCVVLSDVFHNFKTLDNSRKIGMPVLYFKADPHGTLIEQIYNYEDNQNLIDLGVPPDNSIPHPFDIVELLLAIKNPNVPQFDVPHNKNTYILLSAGHDALYGTEDDVYNFGR